MNTLTDFHHWCEVEQLNLENSSMERVDDDDGISGTSTAQAAIY